MPLAFTILLDGKPYDRLPASEGCTTADFAARHWLRLAGHPAKFENRITAEVAR